MTKALDADAGRAEGARVSRLARSFQTASLPGHAAADRFVADELMASSAQEWASYNERSRVAVSASVILAHGRHGDAELAVEMALSEAAHRRREGSSGATTTLISAFWVSVAEAHLNAGQPRDAAVQAATAFEYAKGEAPSQFRALAVLAASRALNGEYPLAGDAIMRASALQAANGWPLHTAHFPLLLAQLLVAAAYLDVATISQCEAQLASVPDNSNWRAAAAVAGAMKLLLQDQIGQAVARVVFVTNGTDNAGISPMIRGFALGILADLLLGRGEPRKALTVLRGKSSPGGHALCFDMQRAAAHIQLSQNRDALKATDECVSLGTEHCLRTLAPVLFRRAIAHWRLGNLDAADASFEDALHIVIASGSATPLLTLPRDELRELLERLDARDPELERRVTELRRRIAAVPMRSDPRFPLPTLTQRERVLSVALRDSNRSFADLARDLHVSLNTVKSQSRTLYRKLGVSSRTEAIAVLERAGFYE